MSEPDWRYGRDEAEASNPPMEAGAAETSGESYCADPEPGGLGFSEVWDYLSKH